MTRETKIGLLVGLAFIVVFAMLLSHSGPTPPPGDSRQLARHKPNPPQPLANDPVADSTASPIASNRETLETPAVTEGSPTSPKVDAPAPSGEDSPDVLPRPGILNPPDGEPAGVERQPTGIAQADDQGKLQSVMRRRPDDVIAPPQPTVRDAMPATTSEPRTVADAGAENPKSETPADDRREVASTEQPAGSSKEHVVLKGENLNKILKAEYGPAYASSYSKVKELFLKANKEHIKDEAMVIEGQKLKVPSLPKELLEPTGPKVIVDAAHKPSERTLGATVGESPRKAPVAPLKVPDARDKDRDKRRDKEGDKTVPSETRQVSNDLRSYEVQSKDTFSAIAREQLGSETFWKEIKRLNPSVDPAKLRPGMKLKLPTKRPLADAMAAGRL